MSEQKTYLSLQDRLTNMTNNSRRNDNFYTTFYGIPENISNVLGRQVKSVTRPTFEIQTTDVRRRGAIYKDKQNLYFTPVSIAFYDDDASVTGTFLYMQLFRQQNKYQDKYGKWDLERDYRFDIKVETYNSHNHVTEGFILRDCFIQSINHSDPVIADSSNCEIVVMVEFDNVDILVFDEYLSLKE